MKKSIYIFIIGLLTVSCNDFFELDRTPQPPFNTLSEFEKVVIGAYTNVFGGYGVGTFAEAYFSAYIFWNNTADDVALLNRTEALDRGFYRNTETNNAWLSDKCWSFLYKAITGANDAFRFIEESGGDPFPTISEDDRQYNYNRIVGELHFIRGLAYYTLANLHCTAYVPGGSNDERQIPLITTMIEGYEDAVNPSIGTVEEVWLQIQSDFKKAAELLPERFLADKMHPSFEIRANKFGAVMMQARTEFMLGNHDKAREYAAVVIEQNGGQYNLSEDPIVAFNQNTKARGKETLLYSPAWDLTHGSRSLAASCFNHTHEFERKEGVKYTTYLDICMDYGAVKRIGWMDNPKSKNDGIKPEALRDKRFTQLMFVRKPYSYKTTTEEEWKAMEDSIYNAKRAEGFIHVIAQSKAKQEVTALRNSIEGACNYDSYLDWNTIVANKLHKKGQSTNFPILRLAEMYLTRSICAYKAGNKAAAAADLNMVRKRAWDETVAGVAYEASDHYVTVANITAEMIHDERIVEMFCEGDRLNYLRGLKVPIPLGEDRSQDTYYTSRYPAIDEPYTSQRFIWSVPQKEKDMNNGYK